MHARLRLRPLLAAATLSALLALHSVPNPAMLAIDDIPEDEEEAEETADAVETPDIAQGLNIAQVPLNLGGSAAPLNMLVLGRDHTLYYEAYNDASDLDGDGVLDVGYKPGKIDYAGYFDSYKCYDYNSSDARFDPRTGRTTNKQCNGAWSGDFLNYLTTARIDALRRVLYGGRRVVDDDDLVVLERSYIPQDAHSWGKEYTSELHDGYDIRNYAPLPLPYPGTRHLFANLTLLKAEGSFPKDDAPLLRVLPHSTFRIWQWVARERPVVSTSCMKSDGSNASCTTSEKVTCAVTQDLELTQTVWNVKTTNKDTGYTGPSTTAQFDKLFSLNATTANFCGEGGISQIDLTQNPFLGQGNGCGNNKFIALFEGTIEIPEAGTYAFTVDGADTVDLSIDGTLVASWYKSHDACSSTNTTCQCSQHLTPDNYYLTAGTHYVRFRHFSWVKTPRAVLRTRMIQPASAFTNYAVRVKVCDSAAGLEANCRAYPAGTYKPAGLLQQHGEDERMLFGLLSGSWTHPYNMRGGALRKNMGSIRDEIDAETGAFTDVVGVIGTIDRMRIIDFNKTVNYNYNGGWVTNKVMADSSNKFPDWGNPIAEMMYETTRYFAGKSGPTTAFRPGTDSTETLTVYDVASADTATIAMPLPTWSDPFAEGVRGSSTCSAGAMLVISDVNPNFDTDQIPGGAFANVSGDLAGLDVQAQANAIWTAEHGAVTRRHFIGQVGSVADGTPSEKSVSGLANVRGLAPAEPTKQGGYYSAAIAKYAYETDLRGDISGRQNLNTVVVALASPLPRIEIPVGGTRVAIVPFGKSVANGTTSNAAKNQYQPTNTIVDFFIESFANTAADGSDRDPDVNDGRPMVRFRINFEDVEQGADPEVSPDKSDLKQPLTYGF